MNITEKFQQFESSFDLSKFTSDGFWYYPLVKTALYFELADSPAAAWKKTGISGSVYIFRQLLKAIIWKLKAGTPAFVKYMFVGSAITRRENKSGYFENIYLDPLMNTLTKEPQMLFEYPAEEFGHYQQTYTTNVYFPDWDILKIFFKAKFKSNKIIFKEAPVKSLYEHFGLRYNKRFLADRLNKTLLFIAFFRKYLAKIKPQIIILIDGYAYKQMALIYAAKELKIPTVELQHGLISESHMAYMYKKVENRQFFPDYLFTFGKYFSNIVTQNSVIWDRENVISVGFPYIEITKNTPVQLPQELEALAGKYDIIYVTSQWTVRDKLRTFILELSKKLDNRYMIFYKIHPGEKDADVFYKPFYSMGNIQLILDKSVNSMEIMKIAQVHSTVYSTSYFESLFFRLPNIFIEVPKYRININQFIDGKTTFLANDVVSYLQYLKKIKNDASLSEQLIVKSDSFYEKNAQKKIKNSLSEFLFFNK